MLRIKLQFGGKIQLEPLERNSNRTVIAKFFLVDKQRFECVSDYSPNLNEIFKTTKTGRYEPSIKKWSVIF
jgi:hypothetical protein